MFLRYFNQTSHLPIAHQQNETETTQQSTQKFNGNQQQLKTTIQQKLETDQQQQHKTTTNQQKHDVDFIWNDLSSN